MESYSRRQFVKKSAINAIGIGAAANVPLFGQPSLAKDGKVSLSQEGTNNLPFIPVRAASWWVNIDDLLWGQKKIIDKIKRRAAGFAEAKIDTAINFGFHIRFDFSNYFGHLHGYYANVCEELHKYGIKFMDHYSCNHVERPRGEAEFKKMHKGQRHHVLLFHDPVAANHAQYEGHFFNDLCQVNLVDGSRGYSKTYQMETFCHNNPGFLDMHTKYLKRLMKEVPFDGIQVDDMCDYAGLVTCGCVYCRERFKKDYGHVIPGFEDFGFWGETKDRPESQWGNYESPVFRDWLRMKADSIADHVKMVKKIIGDKPLMTCCSSSGPIKLNTVTLNLERMSPHLDFFMLENCGTNIKSVNWVRMDAEALHQKDMAQYKGNSPAVACSYTIYEKGGYLGWGLSRFWGVANWSSTHNHRPEEDPEDAREMEDIIGQFNRWEIKNSDLNYREGQDLVEVRLVNSRYCKENGWRRADGVEQWDRAGAWSAQLVKNNIGYRFLRCEELSDANALCKENTPLILDSIGCVSDSQFKAIKTYLSKGGRAWLALPFGTHDEKGFKRENPLSDELLKSRHKNLVILDNVDNKEDGHQGPPLHLENLIKKGKFHSVLKQLSGDNRWAARIRLHSGKPVIHFMSTALVAVPHPVLKDNTGTSILKDIQTKIEDNNLAFQINNNKVPLPQQLLALSPELGEKKVKVDVKDSKRGYSTIKVNLDGVKVYAVVQ